MTLYFRLIAALAIVVSMPLTAPRAWGQPGRELNIQAEVDPRGFLLPIPIHITGFSGAAGGIIAQDLLFMGFKSVPLSEARFVLTGKNGAGRVEGRVTEKVNNNTLVSKAFTGAEERQLIHALADEIAERITRLPGIARRKVLFRTQTANRVSEIYMADYDGFNARAVTRDQDWTVAPCWGPSSMVGYVSYKAGNPRIYTHALTTGTRKMLTPFAGSNISPALSPDGSKIAMILSKDGNPELYVAFADGTGMRRLTKTREDESSPCWSPDGRTILFVSRATGKPGLYTVPVAGGTMKRLRTYGVPNATEPDWSPDGKWILFTTLMGSFQLCLVPAGGGNADTLCAGEDGTWAANSRAVVFCRGEDRSKRLFLLDVPTKQVKDVPRILMSNSQPSWDR